MDKSRYFVHRMGNHPATVEFPTLKEARAWANELRMVGIRAVVSPHADHDHPAHQGDKTS